ncbi:hypothetical protein GCM10010344_58910 [Streptomyces bluensis]|nr:hypothetical protein GCM10010344_58910 [Streptomyces bluensis]
MDNPPGMDADTTDTPPLVSMFAPCPTCENTGERQGAQLFPHGMHKIRDGLWTTAPKAGRAAPLR